MRTKNFTFYILNFAFFIVLGCASSEPTVEMIQKAQAHYKIGVSYLNEGKIQQAFVEFQKAIELDPRNKDAQHGLGLIYDSQGKFQMAIDSYKKAILIDPNFSEAHNNLGVVYGKLKRWDEAIEEYKEAIKNPLYQTPQWAYNNRGFALYSKGDILQAVDAFKEALIVYPNFDLARYNLGRAYMSLGKMKEAIAEFEKAIKINPRYLDAYYELALTYVKVGDKEKAISHFGKVIEISPDSELASSSKRYMDLLK